MAFDSIVHASSVREQSGSALFNLTD
jgi:hypothetical protein